jgi:hypothetical protein
MKADPNGSWTATLRTQENQMKADPSGFGSATLPTQKIKWKQIHPSGSGSATLKTQKIKWKRIQVDPDQQPFKPRKSNESGSKWIRFNDPANPENQMIADPCGSGLATPANHNTIIVNNTYCTLPVRTLTSLPIQYNVS